MQEQPGPAHRWRSALLVHLLCSFVGLGCSSAPPSVVGGVKADRIIIVKSQHSIVLMAHGKPLKSYRVALGKSGGAKERQGDHKTPEGQYVKALRLWYRCVPTGIASRCGEGQ